jgi:hypothetical protein
MGTRMHPGRRAADGAPLSAFSPGIYRNCSESRDHLVTVRAVRSQHAIEVRTVDVHHGHQHVGRRNSGGASPTGDVDRVLGDLCDHVAIVATGASGSRTLGAFALRLEGSFAYAERLQRDPDLAMQAQDS